MGSLIKSRFSSWSWGWKDFNQRIQSKFPNWIPKPSQLASTLGGTQLPTGSEGCSSTFLGYGSLWARALRLLVPSQPVLLLGDSPRFPTGAFGSPHQQLEQFYRSSSSSSSSSRGSSFLLLPHNWKADCFHSSLSYTMLWNFSSSSQTQAPPGVYFPPVAGLMWTHLVYWHRSSKCFTPQTQEHQASPVGEPSLHWDVNKMFTSLTLNVLVVGPGPVGFWGNRTDQDQLSVCLVGSEGPGCCTRCDLVWRLLDHFSTVILFFPRCSVVLGQGSVDDPVWAGLLLLETFDTDEFTVQSVTGRYQNQNWICFGPDLDQI